MVLVCKPVLSAVFTARNQREEERVLQYERESRVGHSREPADVSASCCSHASNGQGCVSNHIQSEFTVLIKEKAMTVRFHGRFTSDTTDSGRSHGECSASRLHSYYMEHTFILALKVFIQNKYLLE